MLLGLFITILLLVQASPGNAQQWKPWAAWQQHSMSFVAGYSNGVNNAILHRFDNTVFAGNPKFWNPAISWKNKYRNWPEDKRAKFPGSKTALVFLTDGWHLTNTIERTAFRLSVITYRQPTGPGKGWKKVSDFFIMSLCYSAGWWTAQKTIVK